MPFNRALNCPLCNLDMGMIKNTKKNYSGHHMYNSTVRLIEQRWDRRKTDPISGLRNRSDRLSEIFYPNILLLETYKKLDVNLELGFNKIDFVALNQGESGPNTAEVRVYDENGNIMMANLWNLATGSKATFIVVRE